MPPRDVPEEIVLGVEEVVEEEDEEEEGGK